MNKRIKGFTLVELLAIITILGIMTILVVPQIGGSINSKKEKELENILDIIENAAKAYHTFNEDEFKIRVSTLVDQNYLASYLENPVTGERLDQCVRVRKDNDDIFFYKYSSCEALLVSLDVRPNGGTLAQEFQSKYYEGTKITLTNPTNSNNEFVGWKVLQGNSVIDGNVLTIGDTDTILWALWKSYPTLTVDLGEGGTTSQDFETSYKSGTKIELIPPTRKGYVFVEWSVSSGNGIVSGNNFTMGSINTTLTANWKISRLIESYRCANKTVGTEPYSFTYTGNCTVVDDGNDNWRVKFLTSGTFTPNQSIKIDVFLVGGGGGGGGAGVDYWNKGGGGGGGGYTAYYNAIAINTGESYKITVGAGGGGGGSQWDGGGTGGKSSAFGKSASGGGGGAASSADKPGGGNGGSGGGGAGGFCTAGFDGADGGSNGSDGGYSEKYNDCTGGPGGSGQGKTTREFGLSSGTLYSTGGGGGGGVGNGEIVGSSSWTGGNQANTGNGGWGGFRESSRSASAGGSGIVVIRNTRSVIQINNNIIGEYTGDYTLTDDGNDNWRVKFLTSGTFTALKDVTIDAFLVGGGGGGGTGAIANNSYSENLPFGAGGGGGGGGFGTTGRSILLNTNSSFSIVIGNGGGPSGTGGTTSAFGFTASGGGPGGNGVRNEQCPSGCGGSGGSGGNNGGQGGNAGTVGQTGSSSATGLREFGESTGSPYAGGGGGGAGYNGYTGTISAGSGGTGGGGAGSSENGGSGSANTGGGGGGGGPTWEGSYGGSGGSGVVVIRNAR